MNNMTRHGFPTLVHGRVGQMPTVERFPSHRLNFAGGRSQVPTVGGFFSAVKRAARSVKNVASDVTDKGSEIARGAVSYIGRPVANVASAIIHPVAYAASDIPVIGKVVSLVPAALGVANTAAKGISAVSSTGSDIGHALFGNDSSGKPITIDNPTSVQGSQTTSTPFADRPVGVVYINAEGARASLVFIGLCQGRNVFIPATTFRPYVVKDSSATEGYSIAFPSKALGNDDWLNTALLLTADDLQKGIGGAITMDDGKVWHIYAHTNLSGDDPRIKATPALHIVGRTSVVVSTDSAFENPNWEGIEEKGTQSTSSITANASGVSMASTPNGTDTSTTTTESTGLSTTAKIGIGAGAALATYLIFGRKDK